MDDCVLCDEPMGAEKSASVGQPMHRACALRSGIGGIGHLLDHEHFCIDRRDPDAGLDYRTSALLVDEYVARVGVEKALNINAGMAECTCEPSHSCVIHGREGMREQ